MPPINYKTKKPKTYRYWTVDETDWLEKNFLRLTNREICKKLNRSRPSVALKASELGLTKDLDRKSEYSENKLTRNWPEKELLFLKENYGKLSPEELVEGLNRSWLSIRRTSNSIGLLYKDVEPKYNTNQRLEVLLDESPTSYYWIGFLMADGHFDTSTIEMKLAYKDKEHLQKFCNYIGVDKVKEATYNGFKVVKFSTKNLAVVQSLRKKFSIDNNKTKNPCDLSNLNLNILDDKSFALAIGYIDGDGSLALNSKSNKITITCYKTWINNLNIISKILGFNDVAHINREGLASIRLNGHERLKAIRNKINELKLPVLLRKWDRINMEYTPKSKKKEQKY